MYLISPQSLEGKINPFYVNYKIGIKKDGAPVQPEWQMWELIGYWPCSESIYYSCSSEHGEVVPVFLGHTVEKNPHSPWYGQNWYFDTETKFHKEHGERITEVREDVVGKEWALFFEGCDDGHCGLRFSSKEEALKWIADCPEIDFKEVIWGVDPFDKPKYKLEWHN